MGILNGKGLHHGRTRVLEAVAPPDATIRFIDQVTRMAPPDVEFSYFSWRRILIGRRDVVHFHWPEYLVRDHRPVRRLARRLLMLLLLLRLRLGRTKVVRTLHNIAPHTPGDHGEQRLLAALDRVVDEFVVLNGCTPVPDARSVTVIRHAHYRDQFASHESRSAVPGRLLFLGRIEAYKGLLELIDIVSAHDVGLSELRIVGRPSPDMEHPLRERLERESDALPITADLTYVTDEAMVAEVTASEAVILPYSEMHNSGVLLVALSLDRPVIVPRSCTTTELAREVGPGWIIEYEGSLDHQKLAAALRALRAHARTSRPTLDTRNWEHVGAQYADVFRS